MFGDLHKLFNFVKLRDHISSKMKMSPLLVEIPVMWNLQKIQWQEIYFWMELLISPYQIISQSSSMSSISEPSELSQDEFMLEETSARTSKGWGGKEYIFLIVEE